MWHQKLKFIKNVLDLNIHEQQTDFLGTILEQF